MHPDTSIAKRFNTRRIACASSLTRPVSQVYFKSKLCSLGEVQLQHLKNQMKRSVEHLMVNVRGNGDTRKRCCTPVVMIKGIES